MKLALLILVFSVSCFASDEAQPSSLIAPFVNLSILVVFLIWKLKGPLSSYFVKKSKDISSLVEKANAKAKEAQMLMESHKKKMAGLDAELKKIKQETANELERFERIYSKETVQKIEKLKTESVNKLDSEKNMYLSQINAELINEVISGAKKAVSCDSSLQKKASESLLRGI